MWDECLAGLPVGIGILCIHSGTCNFSTGSYSEQNQPMQSSTKWRHSRTGLSHYGACFYDAGLGRWINRDPIGEAGGINLYGFVGNDPMNNVDPWGLDWFNDVTLESLRKELQDIGTALSCGPKAAE